MHARVVLGVGKVSCLERCPQFHRERGSTVFSICSSIVKG